MDKPHIIKSLESISQFMDNPNNPGARCLGIHLEGPFISKKFKGAQKEEVIIEFNKDLFDEFLLASNNRIKLVTLAYEENQNGMVDYLSSKGIISSIGHSNCSSELLKQGIEKGITCSTHTFNAMKGIHHREIGTLGQVLLNDNVNAEVIADLHHVSEDALKFLYKNKGQDKVILVTDSMRGKYMEDGNYNLGGQEVIVKDNTARLKDGTLAGSILKMTDGLKNARKVFGLSFTDTIKLATINPARNLHIDSMFGTIEEGKYADLVVIDEDFNVYMCIVNGEIVYSKSK